MSNKLESVSQYIPHNSTLFFLQCFCDVSSPPFVFRNKQICLLCVFPPINQDVRILKGFPLTRQTVFSQKSVDHCAASLTGFLVSQAVEQEGKSRETNKFTCRKCCFIGDLVAPETVLLKICLEYFFYLQK